MLNVEARVPALDRADPDLLPSALQALLLYYQVPLFLVWQINLLQSIRLKETSRREIKGWGNGFQILRRRTKSQGQDRTVSDLTA